MSLVKSTVALYNKYKKPLTLLVLVFFAYNIFIYYNKMKEGLVGATSCTQFTNCSQCVNGQVNNSNSPCYWSKQDKKCGSFIAPGYSRDCSGSSNKCDAISNCQTCIETDCFWGDTDQKCSSTFKAGYGKICSGSNPNPNCPKCEVCPQLTLLRTPTFITSQ